MANPSTTTRQTPSTNPLENGHATKVTFSRLPNFSLWEREVGMPGPDSGEPINVSTMHNVTWETFVFGALIDMTAFDVTGGWNPRCYTDVINTLLRENDSITIRMSNGATIDFWGGMTKFQPQPKKKNEFPMATATIKPTNRDNLSAEAGPVITLVNGTP